jgi:perosamine synthetase
MIPIYKPFLTKESISYANDAVNSTWVSSQGKYLSLATEELKEKLNVKNLLLVNNGTSATHLLAKALNKKFPKVKSIIVPNNVYVAAWNSFLFDNIFNLKTVDANLNTWNFDYNNLNFKKNDAVLIVHNLGNIINVPELKTKYPESVFVEDNCEGFLGKYNNKFSGTDSFASSISFFGNKNITSGEGGAVIINDDEVFEYIKCIHGQGQSSTRFIHNYLGYNYRMTNVQAAILYGQIHHIDQILSMKRQVFKNYIDAFNSSNEISYQQIEKGTEHSHWMFGIRIKNNPGYHVAEDFFKNKKIEIRPMFYPITSHNYINNNKKVKINICDNAIILNKECFILPSYPDLDKDAQSYIIKTTFEYCNYIK